MKPWEEEFDTDIPSGGTGVAPPPPQQGWKVSQADQQQRDRAALVIKNWEAAANPNDLNAQRDAAITRSKLGNSLKPWEEDYEQPAQPAQQSQQSQPYKQQPLADTMRQQTAEGGIFNAFNTGIANAVTRLAAGIGSNLRSHPIYNESAAAKHLPTQRDVDLLEAGSEGSIPARVGQVAGDVAMTAVPAARVFQGGRALGRTLGMVKPWQLAAAGIVPEAAVNAGYGALTADQGNAAEGAAWGAGGTLAGHALARTLRGFTPTADAQALMAQGVQPTVGQSLGGMANTLEQKATSIPFVGDAIHFARNRAQREFEAAAVKRALGIEPAVGPTGQVLRATKDAPRTLDEANAIASDMFDAVVPQLKQGFGAHLYPNEALNDALANPEMTAQNKRILKGIVNEWFDLNKLTKMDGEELKMLDSQLGYLARKYQGGSPADKTMAEEIRNVQRGFREGLNEMLPNDMKDALDEANKAYARLVPINKAASQRADERILPRALQRAMAKQGSIDPSRMRYDNLIDPALKVLPTNIPDSGTAGRLMLGAGGLIGSGSLGLLPQYLAAGGASYLGATRPVQRALLGNTAWQRALAPYDATIAAITAAALRNANRKPQQSDEQ